MELDFKGISIHYEVVGIGDPMVLLHGFLENSTMWKNLLPTLSVSNKVITIDLLGHGNTACIGYVHTMEMMAEAVDAVLEHLKIKEANFIGHSMGGYVALAYLELFPKKVKSLCLVNSNSSADNPERQLNRDRAIAAVKHNHKTFISMSVSNLFAPDNRERLNAEIIQVKNEALKMPIQGIIAALEGMKIRKDRTKLFREAQFKKMLIIGRRDPVLEYDSVMEQILGTDIEIVEFPDGHMSHIENSKELSYEIIRFNEK